MLLSDRAALYWLHFLIEKYTVIDIWEMMIFHAIPRW